MPTQPFSSPEPRLTAPKKCPACGGRMAVAFVTPVMFSDGQEDVTYKCQKCGGEITRSVKGRASY